MFSALPVKAGVECRACGATSAAPHANPFGICFNCHGAFSFGKRADELTETAFLGWLAHRLVVTVKRGLRGQQLGRCEAVSHWGASGTGGGYQCGSRAVAKRDGRLVCHGHRDATDPVFVGTEAANPFKVNAALIRELCDSSEEFSAAVREALA